MPEIADEHSYQVQSYPEGGRHALLINPPVYDAQYWARWSQPAGLLRIATLLRNKGYRRTLIDCMETSATGMVPKRRRLLEDGKQEVVRRDDIERPIYHFGMPLDDLRRRLGELQDEPPDEVWVTSIMTYWWQSTRDVVKLARKAFPKAEILVGGIYPTLAPEHAEERLTGADYIFKGEISEASNLPTDLSLYERPPTYAILTTSRGCPWDCVYCAARALSGKKMRAREIDDVMGEIRDKREKLGIRRFGFYEDNALLARGHHFERLMEAIIESDLKLELYAPEGFETRLLTRDLAAKMRQAGFEKIHLPLETVKSDVNRMWNRRHSSVETFEAAFEHAVAAGFKPRTTDLNVFVLFGLPDERIDDVVDSLLYAHAKVGSVIPMLFTPVPGTRVWGDYKNYLQQEQEFDLQDLNGKFLPFLEYNRRSNPGLRGSDYLQLEGLMAILNQGRVLSRAVNLCDAAGTAAAFRHAVCAMG